MVKPLAKRLSFRLLRGIPPQFPGKCRLAYFLLKPLFGARDIVIEDIFGHRFKIPTLDVRESIGLQLLVNGIYEPQLTKFLLKTVKPGSVFVDIGANIGVFSVLVSSRIGEGTILAVEPSPSVYPYLCENLKLNDISNVTLEQCAVGERNGSFDFYEAPLNAFGMGSFVPQFNKEPIKILTKPLDDICREHKIDHIDILKIDVEGAEAGVLRGASGLLSGKRIGMICFEFCDWAERNLPGSRCGDSQRTLREFGYEIYSLGAYLGGRKKPLRHILVDGFHQLLAIK